MGKSLSFLLVGILIGGVSASILFALVLRSGLRSPNGGSVRTLKLAHSLDTSHPVHQGMVHLKERLEELSGGRLSVDIYPGSVLGGETECLEQVQNGVLDMTKTSSAPMEAFVEEMKVFGLPYVFRDEAHLWTVLQGDIGRELLLKGRDKQLLGLCYYDAGSRNFYTSKRQIKSPRDLEGLKIRVMNSPVSMKMVEALGAAPTPIPWGELYSALAQGTVDGAENNPPSFVSNKHYEICKYFSLDGHTRVPDILLISTRVWESLSPQEQVWLQQAADASSLFQRELWATKTRENLEEAKKLGVEIYEPDIEPFIKQTESVRRRFDGTTVGALLRRIQATP